MAAFLEDKLCASRRLPHSGLLLPPLPSLPSLLDRAGYPRFGLQVLLVLLTYAPMALVRRAQYQLG